MVKNVCFTGHRNIKIIPKLKEALTNQLVNLIKEGASEFYAGGAVGWDMLCENIIIKLREHYPHIKLHLVLPCPAAEQTSKWSESDKAEYIRLLSKADTVEICSKHYCNNCMKVRNQRLVDLSDVCVCYYSGKRHSGTGQTIRMAELQNKIIINMAKS